MNGVMDIYTIIFLALAVVIFLRLRSVLGRRTGNERPPFDPFARRNPAPPAGRDGGDRVIALPPRQNREAGPAPVTGEAPADADVRIRPVAAPGSAVAEQLKRLMAVDRTFDPQGFLEGAKVAYEMVVTAFAEGDRRQLRQLLSRDVYDGFVGAIGERESREEKIEFRFVGIEKAEITEAAIRGNSAQVTVRFNSQLISATKDKTGKVVDGDETKVSDVTDIWTFAREVAARDPNWKLVATESVE
ncbi:MAG: Tim44/TimA family putative adaptor protein [Bauldia sp.]|jgi:predicted lipid-binding transport protein (Tim44 family)